MRRLLSVTAVAGAALWLVACTGNHSSTPGLQTDTTKAPQEPTPVPWEPAEWAFHTPTPVPPPDTTDLPPCDTRTLVVRFTETNGATGGQLLAYFRIDGPSAPCILTGPISVDVVTRSGTLTAEQDAADLLIDPASRDTWLTVSWRINAPATACEPERKASPASEILVHLPGDQVRSLPVAGTRLDEGAMTPCGEIDLWKPRSAPRAQADAAPAPLTFRVVAPATVHAGEELVFEAKPTNTSSQPFTWGDECPGYNVDLYLRDAPPDAAPLHERWTLNCGPVTTLAPGQSVGFQIRFVVPADTLEGDYALYWSLIGPESAASFKKPLSFAPVRILPPR